MSTSKIETLDLLNDAFRSCAASRNAMNNRISPNRTGIILSYPLFSLSTKEFYERSPRETEIQLEIIVRSGADAQV